MANVYEYACLSGHIYNVGKNSYGGLNIFGLRGEPESNTNGWFRMESLEFNMHPSHPCYAALYLKFKNGLAIDAVVAIRGTVPSMLDNDWVDALSWWSEVFGEGQFDRLPGYMGKVWRFVHRSLAYTNQLKQKSKSLRLKVTGHSLGGALAQLVPLKYHPIPAIVFNSPGCGRIPGVELSRHKVIHNINSKYGFINKIGPSVGEVFAIDVPEYEAEAKALFAQFSPTLNDVANALQSSSSLKNPASWEAAKLGGELKFLDYYQSTGALHSFIPNAKNNQVGLTELLNPFVALSEVVSRFVIQQKDELMLAAKTIASQHSIANVVNTLRMGAYHMLAMRAL